MISNKSDMIFRAFLHWLPMPTFKSKKVFNINVQGPSSVRLETALQCMVFFYDKVFRVCSFLISPSCSLESGEDVFRAKSLCFCHKLVKFQGLFMGKCGFPDQNI